MQEKEPQYINSIIRATAILELYEKLNVQYLGIAEISKELGIQKTTVFNIVKTLVHQGWLIQDNPNGLRSGNYGNPRPKESLPYIGPAAYPDAIYSNPHK